MLIVGVGGTLFWNAARGLRKARLDGGSSMKHSSPREGVGTRNHPGLPKRLAEATHAPGEVGQGRPTPETDQLGVVPSR